MSNAVPTSRVSRDAAASVLEAPAAGSHLVQFYEQEETLCETVGRFLRAGLEGGERLIVIATPEHARRFIASLAPHDTARAIADKRLALYDARATLARIMVQGAPDRDRFREVLEEMLAHVGGERVRAYGEMVDLLWMDGEQSAALRLEELWGEACASGGLTLLCAYVMASFYRTQGPGLAEVCSGHTHVLPSDVALDLLAPPDRSETVALRERVRVLEAENAELRKVDAALRALNVERMRDGEARFRLLVESVKDYAIFLLDPSGIVISWNAGAARIKGYAASEIIGKHFSVFYSAEETASGKCDRELEVAVRDGRFEEEGWRLRKDGTRFWANVVITPLVDPAGKPLGFAKVTRDLTDRIRAERDRLQAAQIEEAARRKDEFLGIMGHELRNPLAPLVTAAHMIRLRGGRATEKEMGILDRQLRQMTKIVSDLLDASHAMHGKIELSPKTMEIGEVLADAVDIAAPLLEARHHEISIDVPHHGLTVRVDPDRMAQVFGNILVNAARYTPEGGTIRVRAARSGDDVAASIEDDGQGIAPEMLGRIFDLFTQGDQGLERKGGGLGIGLAVARRLVREHGGEILVESEGLGRGSRFTVRVPHAMVSPRAAPAPVPVLSPDPKDARRILIADDNRDAAELMQELLEHAGHEVRVTFDGASALRASEEFRPEVVLLDIGLPDMDGYEVARRMRQLPGWAAIPIVAVSGYAREEDRARATRSGFSSHLAKPVSLESLTRILSDRRQSQRPA